MISNRRNRLCRMLLVLATGLTLSAEADLSSLFTNLNAQKPPAGRPRRSSIIYIECDSLGYLDLSCNGQKQFATPNLDRLAKEGMLFTNYDAAGADGPTARAALLLGQAPAQTKSYFGPDARSVAQILKASGYHTGLIGEWNFGGPETGNAPWQRGFDEFAGYFNKADAENYFADFMWRYSPRSILNTNDNTWETYVGREPLLRNFGGAKVQFIPDLYQTAAIHFIKNNRPDAASHYQPFFLWLNYPTPRPSHAGAEGTGTGPDVPTDAPYSDEAWPQAEKNKAAMVSRLDADIGRLVDQLQAIAMTNNVAIFFSSATVPRKVGGLDPTFFPSVVSTNDVRLPMIAWWPRHIPAGLVSDAHWSPGNFLATAAQIAMTEYPTNKVGESVLPVLFNHSISNAPAKY